MEILISSTIFAVLLVIVTGTVVQSSGYQTKMKNQTLISEEARRLADKITTDVRSANREVVIPRTTSVITYATGFAILKITSGIEPIRTRDVGTPNALVIGRDDEILVYIISPIFNPTNLYYKSFTRSESLSFDISQYSRINTEGLNVSVTFKSFYAPFSKWDNSNHRKDSQPYLGFEVRVSSQNVPSDYSVIQSAVTLRNYN